MTLFRFSYPIVDIREVRPGFDFDGNHVAKPAGGQTCQPGFRRKLGELSIERDDVDLTGSLAQSL